MAQFRAETDAIHFYTAKAAPAAPHALLLFGRVVTMDAGRSVIYDGVVGIVGTDIVHVATRAAPRQPELNGAIGIETKGTIYPGLIELHNHPAYNAIPLWDAPQQYQNRAEWRKDSPEYVRRVKNPAYLIGKNKLVPDYPRAVARFVECKALLGGLTTISGLYASDGRLYGGLLRNVEFPNEQGWPVVEGWLEDFQTLQQAEQAILPVLGDMTKMRLFHLSEGTNDKAREVFLNLRRQDGSWLLARNIVTIHGLGLQAQDVPVLAGSGGLVWSPLSNLLLYGKTANVAAAKAAGVRLALGADWAPSGSKNLLGELKLARLIGAHEGGLFTDRELVEMVTCSPAAIIGFGPWLGSIEPGKRADLLIIAGKAKPPYAELVEATEEDILGVLISGRPRCGRVDLLNPQDPTIEKFDVGGSTFLIDLNEPGTDPLAGMSLAAAIRQLEYGLAHLPELAKQRINSKSLFSERASAFTLDLDTDERPSSNFATLAEPVIMPGDVDRMALEPVTAVDDAAFTYRLKVARNVPDWLKAML